MRIHFFIILIIVSNGLFAQGKNPHTDLSKWLKATVNLEVEGPKYPPYVLDSVIHSKDFSKLDRRSKDSIIAIYQETNIKSGTALYITYLNRYYLVTAKHILFDSITYAQRKFEMANHKNKWKHLETLYGRISLRTPLSYYKATGGINNFAAFNSNFLPNLEPKFRPYCFSDSMPKDGIAIMSLQYASYKELNVLLQKNGYSALNLNEILSGEEIEYQDSCTTIGFPEGISVFDRILHKNPDSPYYQTPDIVFPFTHEGNISMASPSLPFFYIDMTAYGGESGGPIIKKDRLIGFILSSNTVTVQSNPPLTQLLFVAGHLVFAIKATWLKKLLENYRSEENGFADSE